MDRRHFLKTTSLSSTVVTSLYSAFNSSQTISMQPSKATQSAHDFELDEVSIEQLQEWMKNGKHSSYSLTQLYLQRIKQIDKQGIRLNAIIELNPDALAIAQTMDTERKNAKLRGMLHGIPVLIKDNINTADKMMTTAGALALEGNIAHKDASIVQQLRDAGAVILGKTNLSELANFRSTRSTSGWSSRGGQTKNPCVLDRSPCGSSSGSAAAVAANLCAVALGTETDGSIIAPASQCGIVGLKPTVGLLSRSGIIPISKTQDSAGPMARTVRDVAIVLTYLTSADPDDLATQSLNRRVEKDYLVHCREHSLKGSRIGIEKSFLNTQSASASIFAKAVDVLKQCGATVIEVELMKQTNVLANDEYTVLKYEFKEGINNYLSSASTKVKSLSEMIAFNRTHEKQTMPYFAQEQLEQCNVLGDCESNEYKKAVQKSQSSRTIIDTLMKENTLDAICGISIGAACCIDLVNGDCNTGSYFCSPAAMAGYPHITVPIAKLHELPIGLSFISTAYDEARLLSLAYSFEQATKHREAPKFLTTINPK